MKKTYNKKNLRQYHQNRKIAFSKIDKTGMTIAVIIKGLLLALTAVVMVLAPAQVVFAGTVPFRSYTYDSWISPVPVPHSYVPDRIVRGQDLDIGNFSSPSDIFHFRQTGEVFLVDSGNNRIVMMDAGFNLLGVIEALNNFGEEDSFNQPTGVFVNNTGIFVADTQNNRILVIDREGNVQQEFGRPETDLIPDIMPWLPRNIVVDNAGRIYVIATGVNLGLVELDANGNFRNFKGANRVSFTFWEYVRRRYFSTQEQRQRMIRFVPTEYSGMAIDEMGFIYVTAVTGPPPTTVDAVRRLNARGECILRRLGHGGRVDVIGDIWSAFGGGSSFVDIAIDRHGVYSVLDRTSGRVFTYDHDGNLLDAFGGLGFRVGLLQTPVAIEYVGDFIVIVDSFLNNLTVYRPTEYGLALRQATYLYYLGDYEGSAYYWRIVLDHNANSDLAYVGLGRIHMRNRDFVRARQYFRFANHLDFYSTAFSRHRQEQVQENFPMVATTGIGLSIGLWLFLKIRARRAGKEQELAYDIE